MTAWAPPTPREPVDDDLAAQLATAAAATVHARHEHEAVCAALAAVARCEAEA